MCVWRFCYNSGSFFFVFFCWVGGRGWGSHNKGSPTLGSLLGLPPFMETIIAGFVESQYYESCDVGFLTITIWGIVRIMVPFGVPIIIRGLIRGLI